MATEQRQFTLAQLAQLPPAERTYTGCGIIDKALGGGPVEGTINLFTGTSGSGKSTLMMQMAMITRLKTQYISSEEAPEQVQDKLKRIAGKSDITEFSRGNRLVIQCERDLHKILKTASAFKPELLILDSLQATRPLRKHDPGSPSAMLEIIDELDALTAQWPLVAFAIGHVTKAGRQAGPEKVRHMIDVHLELDETRLLTVSKNRYGEAPVKFKLAMHNGGLKPRK